ncbi:uncharacterized protein [Procambarus clarkii]|uniref:uncharacterized protein n=1 Tax=Procambarus clarkii TaxID=6728 RepID=UPI0037430A68
MKERDVNSKSTKNILKLIAGQAPTSTPVDGAEVQCAEPDVTGAHRPASFLRISTKSFPATTDSIGATTPTTGSPQNGGTQELTRTPQYQHSPPQHGPLSPPPPTHHQTQQELQTLPPSSTEDIALAHSFTSTQIGLPGREVTDERLERFGSGRISSELSTSTMADTPEAQGSGSRECSPRPRKIEAAATTGDTGPCTIEGRKSTGETWSTHTTPTPGSAPRKSRAAGEPSTIAVVEGHMSVSTLFTTTTPGPHTTSSKSSDVEDTGFESTETTAQPSHVALPTTGGCRGTASNTSLTPPSSETSDASGATNGGKVCRGSRGRGSHGRRHLHCNPQPGAPTTRNRSRFGATGNSTHADNSPLTSLMRRMSDLSRSEPF